MGLKTIPFKKIEEHTEDIFEAVTVIAKRARQIIGDRYVIEEERRREEEPRQKNRGEGSRQGRNAEGPGQIAPRQASNEGIPRDAPGQAPRPAWRHRRHPGGSAAAQSPGRHRGPVQHAHPPGRLGHRQLRAGVHARAAGK